MIPIGRRFYIRYTITYRTICVLHRGWPPTSAPDVPCLFASNTEWSANTADGSTEISTLRLKMIFVTAYFMFSDRSWSHIKSPGVPHHVISFIIIMVLNLVRPAEAMSDNV